VGGGSDPSIVIQHPDLYDPRVAAKCVPREQLAFIPRACDAVLAGYDNVYNDSMIFQKLQVYQVIQEFNTILADNVDCVRSFRDLACLISFMPCVTIAVPQELSNLDNAETIDIPVYPCRPFCQTYFTDCFATVAIYYGPNFAATLLDCENPSPLLYGFPRNILFPVNGSQIMEIPYQPPDSTDENDIVWFNSSQQCYDGNATSLVDFSFGEVFLDVCGSLRLEGCLFSCPEPLIDDDEYNSIEIMLSVVSWVSFICCNFLILSWLVDVKKSTPPSTYPVYFFLSLSGVAFSFCFGSMYGHEEVWCDNDQPNNFGDGPCTFQGILYVYCTLASVLWWFVICLSLLLMATKPIVITHSFSVFGWLDISYFSMVCHCLCWSLPMVSVIIALSAERLGYDGSFLWCWIHSDNYVEFYIEPGSGVVYSGGGANWWLYGLLIIPILFILFCGFTVVLIATVVIIKTLKNAKLSLRAQWRSYLLVAIFFVVYLFVFVYQIYWDTAKSDQYSEYRDNLECTYKNQLTQEQNGLQQECNYHSYISPEFLGTVVFLVSFQGVLAFMVFATSADLYIMWGRILTCKEKQLFWSTSTSSNGSSGNMARRQKSVTDITGQQVVAPEKTMKLGAESLSYSDDDYDDGSSDSISTT